MTAEAVHGGKHRKSRFGRAIERADGRDFPFYDGQPIEVAWWAWLIIALACAVGFTALVLMPFPTNVGLLIPRILFPLIPMVVFILVTGRFWRSLFRKVTGWDVLTMFAFFVLNTLVTFALGILVSVFFGAAKNPAADNVLERGPLEVIAFYLGTGIQLLGEEVFTILPFLGLLYVLFAKTRLSRRAAVTVAWIVTAIGFGAAHLPTYQGNFLQAILVIGVARLILTLAYIRTKNLFVSTGAHILNDWWGFTLAIVLGASAAT
jgi:uncharacterized protein